MKVNRPDIISLVERIMKQHQVRSRSKPPEVSASRGERLELSAGSEILKQELARLGEPDTSRTEMLAALARRIENGEYTVDDGELADAILQAMAEGRIS